MHTRTITSALVDAITAYKATGADTGPGEWRVGIGSTHCAGRGVMLTYLLRTERHPSPDVDPSPHPRLDNGDTPWMEWGGEEIIRRAGLGLTDDASSECYVDRAGVEWYADHALFVPDDEEEDDELVPAIGDGEMPAGSMEDWFRITGPVGGGL